MVDRIVWGILVIAIIFAVLEVGTIIIREDQDPAKTAAWLLILAFLPGLGYIFYLIFAAKGMHFWDKHVDLRKLHSLARTAKAGLEEEKLLEEQDGQKLARLLLNSSLAPLTGNNTVELLQTGQVKFKRLIQALEGAREHIHMEYYIFRNDRIGGRIKSLLLEKCAQGVEVRFLVDGVGSYALPRSFFAELQAGGVETAVFSPLHWPSLLRSLNYRNHRKIVVVDGLVGFIGGFNVGDEYLADNAKGVYWRDTHLQLQGACVHLLQATFLNDWHYATRKSESGEKYFPLPELRPNALVQIIASGPDQDWRPSLQLFFTLLTGAREKICIETPYFIPDRGTLMALEAASLGGIDVRLITQGVPDHKITYWASRSYFANLLQAGVKIYAYQKGILHSKVVLVDGKYGVVGSTNFDIRSFELDFEINALIYNRLIVDELETAFTQDIKDAVQVELDGFLNRPLRERMRESTAKLLAPVL